MTEQNTSAAPEGVSDEALDTVVGGGPASFIGETEKNLKRAGDGSVRPGDGSVKPVTTGFAGYGAGTTSV